MVRWPKILELSLRGKGTLPMYSFIFTAFLAAAMVQASPVIQTSTTAPQKAQTQSNPSAPVSDASGKKSGADVAPSDAVITIHGLCNQAGTSGMAGNACTTVVTRQQFDAVLNGLNV